MSAPIDTVVIGASGYVGGELLRLIAGHPAYRLAGAISDSRAGSPVGALFPPLAHAYPKQAFCSMDEALDKVPNHSALALFAAAPHGASGAAVARVLEAASARSLDVHVVDASADFRYPTAAAFETVYGGAHPAPQLLEAFRCAVPEHLTSIDVPHVGHPGCFATAMLLASVPLVAADIVEPTVYITGITGSTGSGRSPQPGTHHPERHSNLYAYKPLSHRHAPEVEALIRAATGRDARVCFIPHSGPFARGIYVTLQARLKYASTGDVVRDALRSYYSSATFVHVIDDTPRLKDVVASNRCYLSASTDGENVVVMGAIDNLVKGAAGGAIQWMNRLWSLPEDAGLVAPAPGWT